MQSTKKDKVLNRRKKDINKQYEENLAIVSGVVVITDI